MAMDDFADIPTRPKIHLSCGARTSARFVSGNLRRFTERGVGPDCPHEPLDNPTVVRREKNIQDVRWWNWLYFLSEIPLGNFNKLWKQDMGRSLTTRLRGVGTSQVTG